MNIHVIFRGPFPYGGVGANRVISYTKEFAKKHHTIVHCIQPTKHYNGCNNNRVVGRYQKILYFYPSGSAVWPRENFPYLKKIFYCILGYYYSFRYIYRFKNKSIIYLYSRSFPDVILYYIISRALKIKLVQERSELPYHQYKHSFFKKVFYFIYINIYISFVYKLFDGLIVETQSLLSFYRKFLRRKDNIFILPNTIDFSRFDNVVITNNEVKSKKFIAYAGNMSKYDGIDILIDAFKLLHLKYPDLHLFLIGKCEETLFNSYLEKVSSYNLNNSVKFLGQISNNEVPQFLVNALALVIASPTSLRNSVSLPYKLGEYLASKRPVVATSVGAIPTFLTDGLNSFIAEPGNVNSLYEKLDKCLSLPEDEKVKIGLEGKKVAYELFDSVRYSNDLLKFITSLT